MLVSTLRKLGSGKDAQESLLGVALLTSLAPGLASLRLLETLVELLSASLSVPALSGVVFVERLPAVLAAETTGIGGGSCGAATPPAGGTTRLARPTTPDVPVDRAPKKRRPLVE